MPAAAFPGSKRLSRETLLDTPIGPAPTEPDGMAPADRAHPPAASLLSRPRNDGTGRQPTGGH